MKAQGVLNRTYAELSSGAAFPMGLGLTKGGSMFLDQVLKEGSAALAVNARPKSTPPKNKLS